MALAYVEGCPTVVRSRAHARRGGGQALVLVKGGARPGTARRGQPHRSLASDDRVSTALPPGRPHAAATRGGVRGGATSPPATAKGNECGPHHSRRLGVVTADALSRSSLELVTLLRTWAKLDEQLPPRWSRAPGRSRRRRDPGHHPNVLDSSRPSRRGRRAVPRFGTVEPAALMRAGRLLPRPRPRRIVDYHERQDTRFAQAARGFGAHESPCSPPPTGRDPPGHAGPAAVRATGRLCYATPTALSPPSTTCGATPAPGGTRDLVRGSAVARPCPPTVGAIAAGWWHDDRELSLGCRQGRACRPSVVTTLLSVRRVPSWWRPIAERGSSPTSKRCRARSPKRPACRRRRGSPSGTRRPALIPASAQNSDGHAALEVLGVEPSVLDRVGRVWRRATTRPRGPPAGDRGDRAGHRRRGAAGSWRCSPAWARRSSSTAPALAREPVTCALLVDSFARNRGALSSGSGGRSVGTWPTGSPAPTSWACGERRRDR